MPAPKRFPGVERIADVRPEADALEAGVVGATAHRLAGRVLGRRVMGKELMFLDLVDRSGRIQLVVQQSGAAADDVDLGDVVGVGGFAMKT